MDTQQRVVPTFATASDAMLVIDAEGIITHANDRARTLLAARSALVGAHLPELLDNRPEELLRRLHAGEDTTTVRSHDDRSPRAYRLSGHPLPDGTTLLRFTDDVPDEQLDPVTGLAGRHLLSSRLQEMIDADLGVGVLTVDIDRFAVINDLNGHDTGDELLLQVGQRLAGVTGRDFVGRIGADVFVAIQPGVTTEAAALALTQRLRDALRRPVRVFDTDIVVEVSVGIALSHAGDAAVELIRRADIALQRGRSSRRSTCIADATATDEALNDMRLDARLRQALEDDDLTVVYQPLCDPTDHPVGVEALVRWPGSGVDVPTLIQVAERSDQIGALGHAVADRALRDLRLLSDAAGRPLRLSLNWSAQQLTGPQALDDLRELLSRHGVEPAQVCIELTESAAIRRGVVAITTLEALRELGVRVAIDDFGTGYSSFAYLQELPIDEVKLDRAFIQRAVIDADGLRVLKGITDLCLGLGFDVVGEGVETAEERESVSVAGCTIWQGYLAARPQAVDQAAVTLQKMTARAADRTGSCAASAMKEVGLVDLLVFKRIADGRFAHLGGHGRGEGWAGIVDVDLSSEPILSDLLSKDGRAVHSAAEPFQVIGPYYARTTGVIEVGDKLVVLGHPSEELQLDMIDEALPVVARMAVTEVQSVSPTKPLADELEVLEAVQELLRFTGGGLDEAVAHLLSVVRGALSCEVGFAWTPDVGVIARGMAPSEADAALLAARVASGAEHQQQAQPDALPGGLVASNEVVAWCAIPLPTERGVLVVAHTRARPRGFTNLCRRLGQTLVASSDVVLTSARAREQLREKASHAASEARTDALTGLLNRMAWNERLDALEPGESAAVVIIDVNRFKALNDRCGHVVGDEVLKEVARRVKAVSPPDAVVARLGGDEFGVLLTDASEVQASEVAAAHRRVLVDLPTSTGESVSGAVGSAHVPPGQDIRAAIEIADKRMYAHKASSR